MDRRFMAFWHKKQNWDYFFGPVERSESGMTNDSGGVLLALFIVFAGIALMSAGKKK
jgi:hypothetical protein